MTYVLHSSLVSTRLYRIEKKSMFYFFILNYLYFKENITKIIIYNVTLFGNGCFNLNTILHHIWHTTRTWLHLCILHLHIFSFYYLPHRGDDRFGQFFPLLAMWYWITSRFILSVPSIFIVHPNHCWLSYVYVFFPKKNIF